MGDELSRGIGKYWVLFLQPLLNRGSGWQSRWSFTTRPSDQSWNMTLLFLKH